MEKLSPTAMPWEERNGNQYYYRKERDGDTVRSMYVGDGPLAQAAASIDRKRRKEREKKRKAWKEAKKAHKKAEDIARKAERFIRAVRNAALVASGYHTHKGQWRKSRSYDEHEVRAMANSFPNLERGSSESPPNPHVCIPSSIPDDIQDLLKRVREVKEEPSAVDRAKLQRALQDYPEIVEAVGDVARHARDLTVRANFSASDVRAAAKKKMASLQGELASETARDGAVPATERLIIEQVVIMWAQYYAVQIKYERATYGSHSLKRGRYWEKRLSAAQRRYLRALRTLSNVRKMNITIQVNAAAHQEIVNT